MLKWKCKFLSILLLWSTSCLLPTPDEAVQTSKEYGAEVRERAVAGWMHMEMGHMLLLTGAAVQHVSWAGATASLLQPPRSFLMGSGKMGSY